MNLSIDDELAQDSFKGHDFVAKIAWQATADKLGDPNKFDATILHDAFVSKLQELKSIKDSYQKRCDRLEEVCKDEERRHCANVRDLKERFRQSINTFNSMDNRLDAVANKVHDLGRQLEIINRPRSRAAEAYKLLKQFGEFLNPSYKPPSFSVNKKSSFFEEADLIHKLYLISQDFPKSELFIRTKEKIERRFSDIEKELIEEFVQAYRNDDKGYMKEVATIMSNFEGYNQCVDAFIEHSLVGVIIGGSLFDHREGFSEILNLCEKIQLIAQEVFKNPDEVMSKLLLNIYTGKLKDYIVDSMKIHNDQEKYLNELHNLYTRTVKLSSQIVDSKILGSRDLDMLTKRIFHEYLKSYPKTEIDSLKEKCSNILNRYYESKNHQKKTTTGGIQDLKARFSRTKNLNISGLGNINVNIGPLANINISVASDPLPPGETFLSEEIGINILHEIKLALNRSRDLPRSGDVMKVGETECVVEIFDVQIQYLCVGHLAYAIELGLSIIANADTKTQTDLRFLDIVRQCNSIWHLIEKQFTDSFQPQLTKAELKNSYRECMERKREILSQLEAKLNEGLERTLNHCTNWIRNTLDSNQRKTDFRPENEDATPAVSTVACSKVSKFVKMVRDKILDCLDGDNVDVVYNEFGTRFHKTIYEHLQKFEFNSIGGMIAISDVKAYSSAIKIPNRPINHTTKAWPNNKNVDDMFDLLHMLCNLWVVAPENLEELLQQLLEDKKLADQVDRTAMQQKLTTFAALRADNRDASKIMNILNHFRQT